LLDKNLARPGQPELYLHRVQQFRRVEGRDEPLTTIDLTTTGTGTGGPQRFGGPTPSVPTASTAPRNETTIQKGKVVWNAPQTDINISVNWANPTSQQVWLTQEDIWVYQALLWVVAESNKGVTEARRTIPASGTGPGAINTASPSAPLNLRDSVVKEIVELSIGSKAAGELEKRAGQRISGGTTGGSGGAGAGSSSGSDPMAGRYVGADGKPLDAPDLNGQLRRMPVYLRFIVDQNRIHEVLVNCANCPMPIDVLWVNINPSAGKSFDFTSSSTASGGGTPSGGGGFVPRPGFTQNIPQAPSGGSGRTGASEVDYGPDVVTIEILGCINIFSPPDASRLGGGT